MREAVLVLVSDGVADVDGVDVIEEPKLGLSLTVGDVELEKEVELEVESVPLTLDVGESDIDTESDADAVGEKVPVCECVAA